MCHILAKEGNLIELRDVRISCGPEVKIKDKFLKSLVLGFTVIS